MWKPAIVQPDLKSIAMPGEFRIIPGSNDIAFHVGAVAAFLDQDEVYKLVRTLDHFATTVWGDAWVERFTEKEHDGGNQ